MWVVQDDLVFNCGVSKTSKNLSEHGWLSVLGDKLFVQVTKGVLEIICNFKNIRLICGHLPIA